MSLSVSEVVVDSRLKLNSNQLSLLQELKQWVETEAPFKGRSEKEFLVLFLRSCDFDLELSKKTLQLYYLARVKYPQWWGNRDLNHPQIQFLIQQRSATMLLDYADNSKCPIVVIAHLSRLGSNSSIMDPLLMLGGFAADLAAHRTNCQLNGGILILDVASYYSWTLWKFLCPTFCRDIINAFLLSIPIKTKMVVMVNATAVTYAATNFFREFLSTDLKHKLQCCRSWNDIDKFIPLEVLPIEYGGTAGPLKDLQDKAYKELLAMNDYFLDDNKYGY